MKDKIITLPPGKYGARREKGSDVKFELALGDTVEVFGWTIVCEENKENDKRKTT